MRNWELLMLLTVCIKQQMADQTGSKPISGLQGWGTLHFYDENEGFNIESVWAYEGGDMPTFKGSIYYETKDGGLTWSKSDVIESLHLGLTYFLHNNEGYGFNNSEFYTIKKQQ